MELKNPELLLKTTLKETSVKKSKSGVLSSKMVPETGNFEGHLF